MACTNSRHEVLKKDRHLFEAVTKFTGWQVIEDVLDALELRCCTLCRSTLSDGTLRSGRRYEDVVADAVLS